jgi:hypothetical protein
MNLATGRREWKSPQDRISLHDSQIHAQPRAVRTNGAGDAVVSGRSGSSTVDPGTAAGEHRKSPIVVRRLPVRQPRCRHRRRRCRGGTAAGSARRWNAGRPARSLRWAPFWRDRDIQTGRSSASPASPSCKLPATDLARGAPTVPDCPNCMVTGLPLPVGVDHDVRPATGREAHRAAPRRLLAQSADSPHCAVGAPRLRGCACRGR